MSLAPTSEQDALFPRFAGVCRLVHNIGREQRSVRDTGSGLGHAAQCRKLPALRAAFDGVAAVSETCQEQALRALDRAIDNCFDGRAKHPTPRRRSDNDAFRFQGPGTHGAAPQCQKSSWCSVIDAASRES